MIVFFAYKVEGDLAYFDEEESRHCMKVLRKKTGGTIQFTDGNGILYKGEILNSNREVVLNNLEILEESKVESRIIVAISPTKNLSRFEWFVEKAVEIGVTDIVPLICDRTERKNIKDDRARRIIRSAAKQSLNYCHPVLHDVMSVRELIDFFSSYKLDRYIASYDEQNKHLFVVSKKQNNSIILIGPEGDFKEDELALAIENGFVKVNISKSRLRTETAGVVAGEILCLKNEILD